MAIVTGARTNLNTTSTNKAIEMDRRMRYTQDYQTPLNQFYVMTKQGSKSTKESRSIFRWHEKTPLARSTTVSSGITGGSTTAAAIPVADDIFRVYDTIFVESTGDTLRVTAVDTSAHTISVIKTTGLAAGVYATAGNIVTVSANATIRNLVPSATEVYARTSSLTNNATEITGYCQIGLDAVQMSGREDATDHWTDGEDFKALIDEKLVEISKYEERKWLLNGIPYDDQSNNFTYSGGFRGMVQTNVSYYNGTYIDEPALDDALETIYAKQDTNILYGYAGTKFIRGLGKMMKDRFSWKISQEEIIKAYGGISKQGGSPQLLRYNSDFGIVYFMWDPLLEGDVFAYSALILNRKHSRMRFMQNDSIGSRKFRIEPNVQDLGTGSIMDQMIWDTGLEVGPEVYDGWIHKRF